jgi:hypothetical protein
MYYNVDGKWNKRRIAMNASIVSRSPNSITLQVQIPLHGSMLAMEEAILHGSNQIGSLATQEALGMFDTDGNPIQIGEVKMTSKGPVPKEYQTPFGAVTLSRHVYQTSDGGRTYCPLDDKARIIVSSTPRFAKVVSHKYADLGSSGVCTDLEISQGRLVARSFVQNVSEAVGSIILAREESWTYSTPIPKDTKIDVVTIGVDGTCAHMCDDGWRETMVGSISLYSKGERIHTTYIGAVPEYGKATFYERMEREIEHVKASLPDAIYVGIADGANGNWEFLKKHTTHQTLDFYHATEYLTKTADGAFLRQPKARKAWLDSACHRLKHNKTGPPALIREMMAFLAEARTEEAQEKIGASLTYFKNQKKRMSYADNVIRGIPIGSGVTEAACKTIVKQRLCCSGMKWKERGASIVLALRCLSHTEGRWPQLWGKIQQYGVPEVEWVHQ